MTEQEIITYLKQNKTKGVAFAFMPMEVKHWCGFHSPAKIFKVFDGFWSDSCIIRSFKASNIYCLADDYEPEPLFEPDWVEFEIDRDGCFEFEGKRYYYREDARFETENRDKFKGFGGWLCADGKWRTYPPLRMNINGTECYNGTCAYDCEPAIPIKIRFQRYKE